MTELWSADQRVLAEIVRQMEVDGLDTADCYAAFDALEIDPDARIPLSEAAGESGPARRADDFRWHLWFRCVRVGTWRKLQSN